MSELLPSCIWALSALVWLRTVVVGSIKTKAADLIYDRIACGVSRADVEKEWALFNSVSFFRLFWDPRKWRVEQAYPWLSPKKDTRDGM